MAQRDLLKRYMDAGMAFTAMTKSRAEAIVKEMVKAGEVQRDQVQSQVEEIIDRSRRNTDHLIALVRKEVTAQLAELGLATRRDLETLERRVRGAGRKGAGIAAEAPAPAPAKKAPAPATKAPAKKAPATKAPATIAPAKKGPPAKKAPAAKDAPATKAPAAAAPAKKAASKDAPATKAPAKRARARKATASKSTTATTAVAGDRPNTPPATVSPPAGQAPGPPTDNGPSAPASSP